MRLSPPPPFVCSLWSVRRNALDEDSARSVEKHEICKFIALPYLRPKYDVYILSWDLVKHGVFC